MSSSKPFPVTIVGAGIAGLIAALHLRKSGYEVTVFEQSRLATEIGAAFHITPNATAILASLDIDVFEGGAVEYRATNFLTRDGTLIQRAPKAKTFEGLPKGEDWVMAHRYHLHKQLKEAAVARGVNLVTSKRVQTVDPEKLEIHFQDGSTHQAQCILGSDGVHSKVREALYPHVHPEATPYAAFRFMLDRSEVEKHADAFKKGLLRPGELYLWGKPDIQLLVYPTYNDTKLNFVCLFPTRMLDDAPEHDSQYSQKASKEQMYEIFQEFEPQVQELLHMADPDQLRYWPLMDMADIPSFVNSNVALLGDAAHPFLPFAFQGAGLAIEDGATIGVMLEDLKSKEDLGKRLQLYEQLRHERCSKEQQFSRDMFKDHSKDMAWNPAQAFADIYLYRVMDSARKLKREHGIA